MLEIYQQYVRNISVTVTLPLKYVITTSFPLNIGNQFTSLKMYTWLFSDDGVDLTLLGCQQEMQKCRIISEMVYLLYFTF